MSWGTIIGKTEHILYCIICLSFFLSPNRTYHEMGVATRPDYSQAIKWYKKASYKGYGPAENKLNIPFNQRVSRRMANSTNGEEGKEVKNQPQLLVAKKNKKYYEESVRIAEKSRKATATSVEGGGESCQIM